MTLGKLATYFAPFVANATLRSIGIPLTTYLLGPEEFGLFALMMGVVNICTVLASSVTGYVINHHFKPGQIAPNRLITTLAVLEIGIGLVLAVICFAGWSGFSRWMGVAGEVSPFGFLLLLLSVPLGAFWTSGSMMIIFDGRAKLYSCTMIGQGIVQLATSLFALYVLGWHVGALIAGQVSGIATAAVGGYIGLRRHLSLGIDRTIVRESVSLMPWSMLSGFANSATDLLERVILARVASTHALGLYVHSQNYRTMLGSAGKAFVQVLQPTMMREAHSEKMDFRETRAGWNIVYAMFTSAGLVFSLVGKEVVGLLTHGKFTNAAVFVPFWCVFLTFQYLGRPQTATLYARGQGKRMSSAILAGKLASGALMLLLGLPLQAFGLVIAVLIGELINRSILQYWTYRLWKLPFQDGAALAGAALVISCNLFFFWIPVAFVFRASLLACATVVMLVLVWKSGQKFLSDNLGMLQKAP